MTIRPGSTGSNPSSTGDRGIDQPREQADAHSGNEASHYIRDNFEPSDRLALVVINRRNGGVIQRIAPAESMAAEDFQQWLRYMNRNNYDVYISMNALKEDARGRTKADVGAIRHVYLDLDHGGDEALQQLLARSDLPKPSYVLATSPGKYQVAWKVEGFTPEQAEGLQRGLAREVGADPAATDASRVLRVPGFYNRKYAKPHLVQAEVMSREVYRPEQFPALSEMDQDRTRQQPAGNQCNRARPAGARLSQSERDWAYARRALARGEPTEAVINATASYRRFDKNRPRYYAQLTVEKAWRSLESRGRAHGQEYAVRER